VVLYCATDLLWATRIKGTGDALGIPCRPVRSLDMLRARLADSDVRGVIVDLEAGEIALQIIAALRSEAGAGDGLKTETPARIPVVAFGPHVGVETLDAARRAGADRVMSRGAFDRSLPALLAELEPGGG
jgi:hypothetical protein